MRFQARDAITRQAAADGGTATSLAHPDRTYTQAGRTAFLDGFESDQDVPCRVCGVHPAIPADLPLGKFQARVAQVKRRHFRRLRLGWKAKDPETGTRPPKGPRPAERPSPREVGRITVKPTPAPGRGQR
jgi:hypothetical protein